MATNRKERKERLKNTASGVMGCSLYSLLVLIRLFVGICIMLVLAEWLFPKYVNIFNFKLSTRTFVELKAAHRYKAAVEFYEHKHGLFEKRDALDIMVEVSDCYKRIGEYEKAEKILLDIFEQRGLSEDHKEEFQKEQWRMDAYKSFYARELFKLYEEIGDQAGQKRAYEVMEACYTDDVLKEYNRILKSLKAKREFSYDDLMRIYRLKILYQDAPEEAITQMSKYLGSIKTNTDVSPAYLLKCLNLITAWTVEQHGVMDAYRIISTAVDFADSHEEIMEDKSEYGNLSDWCYRVHDVKNSKKFYEKYSVYLKRTSGPTDPEYIKNQIRGFKFLADAERWEDLSMQVRECCEGLRTLLSKNIPLMNESQREYFVALLGMPFDYAIDLLHAHPSNDLARLCFENSLYMKGLLLRSSRELSNKIKASGDNALLEAYEQLMKYREELSYRENLGKIGNALVVSQLKNKIDKLDKELTFSSKDYQLDKEKSDVDIADISKVLDDSSCAIDFVQSRSGNLVALLLRNDGSVASFGIGSENDLSGMLTGNPTRDYSNPQLTRKVWEPVESRLEGVKDIYYSTAGLFNSISFPALYIGNNEYLGDKYRFHLLSNAANLLSLNEDKPLSKEHFAIWGDIDYGSEPEATAEEQEREITRGDSLSHLAFSRAEILAIGNIASENSISSTTFSGTEASEASFRGRSGAGDNILHISTHGFFHEDEMHEKSYNPMYNSGLFFAGANYTWNSTDSVFVQEALMDDGILRADEIQYLDFSDCSLAVLSACKTGLGKSESIEGIYGLQRAFKLAGVDRIIMSLWNVNDLCTAELMSHFYRFYLAGDTEEDALNKAVAIIRERYDSPRYWGAFVLLY